jgi:transglutaminase-like putative cysteine protease
MTFVFLIIFLIAVGITVYGFINKEWETFYTPESYATIYYPSDYPLIKDFSQISQTRIQIHISNKNTVNRWRLEADGMEPQTSYGMSPEFDINPEEFTTINYTLKAVDPSDVASVVFSIRFLSKEYYMERGLNRKDVYLVSSDLPYGKFKQYPLTFWSDDYHYLTEEQLAETENILAEMGIEGDDSTLVKMEKITVYLRRKLINARGVPKDDLRWYDPLTLYKQMLSGDCKGWCTQHAQLFTFYASRAGVPTRQVFACRDVKKMFTFNGHAWAESWVSEQQRWAYVDLSHGHVYVTNAGGEVLNTVQLYFLQQANSFEGIQLRLFSDWEWQEQFGVSDSLTTVPFMECNQVMVNQMVKQAAFKFRNVPQVESVRDEYKGFLKNKTFLWGNLKRYFLVPQPAWSPYSEDHVRALNFQRKLMFWITILSFTGMLITGLM